MRPRPQTTPPLRFPEFQQEWTVEKIGKVTDYVDYRGKTPPKSDTGVFLVTAKNVKAGYIDYECSREYVPDAVYEEVMRRGKPLLGDVLITTEAPLGNVASIDRENIALAQRVIKLRGKTNILSNQFLKHRLLTPQFQRSLFEKSTGSTAKGIKGAVLHELPLAFPKVPEQEKVAAFLSTVDEKIAQLGRKKELLVKYKKGVMQQIFDQEIRFKDGNGNDFPDWENLCFHDIARLRKEKFNASTSASRKCVELEHLDQGTGRLLGTIDSTIQKSIKNVFVKGDTLFGKLRPYLEKYWHAAFDGVCSTEIWVMRPSSGFLSSFLFYLMQSASFFQAVNVSSGSKMPRAEWDVVSKYLFSVPTDEREQSKIADFLSGLDQKIELINLQLELTKNFKRGLLQQMFV